MSDFGDFMKLGLVELQNAVLQQEPMPQMQTAPVEAPQVAAPQQSFEAELASYAAQAPAQDMSQGIER